MEASNSERVICPNCRKPYRWQATLAGRTIPCKECDTEFIIPDQPGLGLTVAKQPVVKEEDLYELASDPDEELELPPAHKTPPKPPIQDHEPSPSTPTDSDKEDAPSEPNIHISEAAKASRREQQRIAAAEQEAERTWRDHKGLITLASIVGLFVIIYLAMLYFS
ncbi:MAG: hypothetical protein AB8C95_10490 [Phycisphaeraceae bacterium]